MTRVIIESGPDAGALAHVGNPLAEQRALLAGEAFVDLSHRDVVRVAGPDMRSWLHAITAQDVLGLPEETMADVLALDAQGRIRFALEGVIRGDVFTAHTEPGAGDVVVKFLQSMVFSRRVEVTQPEGVRVLELAREPGRLERVLAEVSDDPCDGWPEVGLWASEALRIAEGRPRWGLDTDERSIPNELGLWGTALDKGCYPGQETVGRVWTLGRPPRRLVRLQLDGSEDRLPAVGADVVGDGRAIGRAGSSALHHEDGPIGLAVVKRTVPVDATLVVDGIPATQEALVDPEVGLHVRPRL